MFKEFLPDYIYDDIYEIDYNHLYNNDIRLLIFDIDGTILKSMNFTINERLIELLKNLKEKGFTVTLLTNAGNKRLNPVLEKTKIKNGIAYAEKPKSEGFENIMKKYAFSKKHIAMIGNDLYADIYGANKFGITSILVGSIDLTPTTNKVNKYILKKIKHFNK